MWPIMDEHKLIRRIPITNGHGEGIPKRRATRSDKGGTHKADPKHVYRLESDIPIPVKSPRGAAKAERTWGIAGAVRRMEVSQSFLIRCSDKDRQIKRNRITAAARTQNRRKGTSVKLVTRSVDGGIRVWRVA